MKIKDIPIEERPRERLINYGVDTLSNEELLAIIIKNGTKNKSSKDIAIEILNKYQSINNLININYNSLMEIDGIGIAKAIEIISSIELGKRVNYIPNKKKKVRYSQAIDIYNDNKHLFFRKKQEYFYCLYFNNKQELITRKLLFIGTINQSLVHPREVFKEAYLSSASSIICIHNHPSNDELPSKEDILFTDSLVKLGQLNQMPVLDHLIITDNSYYSFYENNLIN